MGGWPTASVTRAAKTERLMPAENGWTSGSCRRAKRSIAPR